MTTTISASPRTLADSAPQLIQHDRIHTQRGSISRATLPDPAHLQPSLAKRRIKADRHLLSGLGRMRNTSTRRSSSKAIGKRMFFLLSGRHHMRKVVSLSYEHVPQLDKKASLVSQYRLPSFRDGFPDWIQDTNQMNSMQSKIALERVSNWQENAGMQLPSILTLLKREWY